MYLHTAFNLKNRKPYKPSTQYRFYQFHIVAQFKRQFSGIFIIFFFYILWFQILHLFYIWSFMTNFIVFFKV